MKRRTLLKAAGAAAAIGLTQRVYAFPNKPATIRWWYHFDDPRHRLRALSPSSKRRIPASAFMHKAFRGAVVAITTRACTRP
jgi:hypothetical protein